MDFYEAKKHYTRFLKEHGIFRRACIIHTHKGKRRENFEKILRSTFHYDSWMENANVFCVWSGTKEREPFWWCLSLLWQIECVENRIWGEAYVDKFYISHFVNTLIEDVKRLTTEYNKDSLTPQIFSDIHNRNMQELVNKIKPLEKLKENE